MQPYAFGQKCASLVNDYIRTPDHAEALRQLAIASTIGGALGLGRGLIQPGYHEKLDAKGNVIAKKRRSRLHGGLEGAAVGAASSALASYASQVAAQYNPEFDSALKNTTKSIGSLFTPRTPATG